METNLNAFERGGVSASRIQAVEAAVNLLASGFYPIDKDISVDMTFNPIKLTADWIEKALGVEDKEKQTYSNDEIVEILEGQKKSQSHYEKEINRKLKQ